MLFEDWTKNNPGDLTCEQNMEPVSKAAAQCNGQLKFRDDIRIRIRNRFIGTGFDHI